jgi:hypothetical protein
LLELPFHAKRPNDIVFLSLEIRPVSKLLKAVNSLRASSIGINNKESDR